MRVVRCLTLLCGAWLLLAGCAAVPPFDETVLVPLAPRPVAEVAGCDWTGNQGALTIRQTALLQMLGGSWTMNGLVRLDPAAGTARLVALDDMGIKLFDLVVTADGYEEHYLMPALARWPGLPAAVATSVRRIYVDPRPNAHDILQNQPDRYLLRRGDVDGETVFVFGGEPPQLLQKRWQGRDADSAGWQIRYFEYRTVDGRRWPRGIVLDDAANGSRLTLWLESVKGVR